MGKLRRHASCARRNIDVRLETRLDSCEDRVAVLSDGARFPTRTVVWTAGVKPHPILAATDLPLNERGRLKCTAAARPSTAPTTPGPPGTPPPSPTSPPTSPARSAPPTPSTPCARPRSSPRTSSRVAARRARSRTYAHKYAGSVASLGLHKGVAHVYGRKLKGYPAWFMHRVYHLSRVPTFNRKARVLAEWTLSGLFKTRDRLPRLAGTPARRVRTRRGPDGTTKPDRRPEGSRA